jgi:hypothetical protein
MWRQRAFWPLFTDSAMLSALADMRAQSSNSVTVTTKRELACPIRFSPSLSKESWFSNLDLEISPEVLL